MVFGFENGPEVFIHDSWAEFKKYINGTYATLAFQFSETSTFYKIITEPFVLNSQVYDLEKNGGADQVDFDTNFKNLSFRKPGSFQLNQTSGQAANGSPVSGNPILVAGSDGTNVRTVSTDTSGKLNSNISSWIGSTSPTVGQKAMASSLPVAISSDQSSIPVSGTVTANIGTSGSLALDATLTSGNQKAIVRGGAKGSTTAADVTSTSEGTNNQALDVQIWHGGSSKDPTQIRSLTGADIVTSNQGAAAPLASRWPVIVTDGTNTAPTMDAVGRSGFQKITDGTNTATVKAASTAAIATDQALVVAISPNNSFTIAGNKSNNGGAPGSNNMGVLPVVANASAPSFTEGNQVALSSSLNGSLRTDNTAWLGSTAPTVGQKTMTNSLPVVISSDQSTINAQVTGNVLAGSAISGNPVQVAGSDGTNVRRILTDSTGALVLSTTANLNVTTGYNQNFSAIATNIATAALGNKSMLSIVNTSATDIIRIKKIKIVNAQTTAITGVFSTFEMRRITGHSLGAAVSIEQMDLNDAIPAGVSIQTGATVVGESVKLINRYIFTTEEVKTSGTAGFEAFEIALQRFSSAYEAINGSTPLSLRQNQGITVKCITATATGVFDIYVEFTKE